MPAIAATCRILATACVSGAVWAATGAALTGVMRGEASAIGGAAETTARPAGLDTVVSAAWTGLPLREWAASMSRIGGVPIVVDRRIDPTTPITLECRGDGLGDVLRRVARGVSAEVEVLASTIRIVPRAVAGQAAAAEAARTAELAALPAGDRGRAAARASWTWPTAARPRDLIAEVAADAGLDVAGIETIPHDHLPATALPPLSVAERFDLVLADFDRRVAWLPRGPAVVAISARLDGLEPARTASGPRPRPPLRRLTRPGTGRDVFTLRLEAPLDQALTAIAARLELPLSLDAASLAARGIAPGEIVRVEVTDVSRDELLDAVAAPLSLAWSIEDGRLRVYAPPLAR
jgi:hypothetical protein